MYLNRKTKKRQKKKKKGEREKASKKELQEGAQEPTDGEVVPTTIDLVGDVVEMFLRDVKGARHHVRVVSPPSHVTRHQHVRCRSLALRLGEIHERTRVGRSPISLPRSCVEMPIVPCAGAGCIPCVHVS